jgi:hypothetical protein
MSTSTVWRYRVVDVFTNEPLQGNGLAVFPDASGIPEQRMQAIAREFNLSETVFLLPAADKKFAAKLRIFTLRPSAPASFCWMSKLFRVEQRTSFWTKRLAPCRSASSPATRR